MLAFVTKTSRETEAKIKWLQMTQMPGTTALLQVPREARPGSCLTHVLYDKVKLVGMNASGNLMIQLLDSGVQEEVEADDCGPPFYASVKVMPNAPGAAGPSSSSSHRFSAAILSAAGFSTGSTGMGSSSMGLSGKAAGKQPAKPAAVPKKRGRPAGRKDSVPRLKRGAAIAWEYAGKKAVGGTQFAKLGEAVEHDGMVGPLVLVQQPNATSLMLQSGEGDAGFLVTVAGSLVRAIGAAVNSGETRASGAGTRRAFKPRRKREARVQQAYSASIPLATKAAAEAVRGRRKREATALARGKPLKPARVVKNMRWAPALKDTAVALYLASYTTGSRWGDCAAALKLLPGFESVERGHIKAWVAVASKRALQVPNEDGLVITQAGRKPELPPALYNELKEQLVVLAKTQAFTLNSTTLRPIVLGFLCTELGSHVIRPGPRGFIVGGRWLKRLAHAAELKWRKPYGDARKHPANAQELINDLILRLAYLMHEHSVPPALVLNFDQSGLHFMQMRGNTWTFVEADTERHHTSRPNKNKESKQQGVGDKRQATGTVGNSMAGDVLPGQLLVTGSPNSHLALPQLDGNRCVLPPTPSPSPPPPPPPPPLPTHPHPPSSTNPTPP